MRLEITRRAELAVRAMVALGASEGRLKAPDLAEALGTTSGFVPQDPDDSEPPPVEDPAENVPEPPSEQ